jgi:hypothetical protein
MTSYVESLLYRSRASQHRGLLPSVLFLVGLGLFLLLAGGCQPAGAPIAASAPSPLPPLTPFEAGPRAWIENPLDGEVLAEGEPVVFVAYATDAQGVAAIELRLNGEALPAAVGDAVGSPGSRDLVRLEHSWPPGTKGEMVLEARGRSTGGKYGEPAYTRFCVGDCQAETPTPTPSTAVTPSPSASPQPPGTPTLTPTQAPSPEYDLYVRRMDFSTDTPTVGEVVDLFIMIATDTYPQAGPFFPESSFRWRQGPSYPWQSGLCPPNNQYASCTVTVQFAYDKPGSYLVEVEADDRQQVTELDEGNNTNSWTVTVTAAATATPTPTPAPEYDLYVRRMDFNTDTPTVGQTVELFVMIATDSYPQAGPFFPASTFRWRQGPSYPWQEVACPPNNQYASCTQTLQFSYAQPGSYVVEVQADSLGQVAEQDEGNNTNSWTVTVGQAVTPTLTPPPPLPPAQVEFGAAPQYIDAGSCTTLVWNVQGVNAIYLDGQGVVGQGSQQVCPCSDTTYTLRVVHADNSETTHGVTVYVSGTCEQPTEEVLDTSGPNISDVGTEWRSEDGCKFYGLARISDPSGVSWAKFFYQLDGGGWNSLWMSDLGGGYWVADAGIGIFQTSGYIDYYVIAGDSVGNESESGSRSGDYWMCGGG